MNHAWNFDCQPATLRPQARLAFAGSTQFRLDRATRFWLLTLLIGVTLGSLSPAKTLLAAEETAEKTEEKKEEAPKEVSIFADKNLEEVVRHYVFEKRNSDKPITAKDVENISTIEGKGKQIKNLAGLEHCYSLALLDLENNEVSDLSPIKELTNIQQLNLAKNQISDIKPISELTKLQYLHLADNRVADLKPLEKMQNMRSLYLSNNKLENLSAISTLTKIWSLYIDGNQVSDLSPLSGLKWLSSFDGRKNKIADLGPLASLTELHFLMLDGNQIKDVEVLVKMAEQDVAGPNRFAPFWRLYLKDNPLNEAAEGHLKKLVELGAEVE